MEPPWRSLLEGTASATTIAVEGVKLGDPASSLPGTATIYKLGPTSAIAHCEGVSWVLEQQRVAQIVLRVGAPDTNALARLFTRPPGKREMLRLGEPAAIQRRSAGIIYHYPQHHLEVLLDRDAVVIESITCAQTPWPGCEIGPDAVLAAVIDGVRVLGQQWDAPPNTRTGVVHLQRITAIGQAFELGSPMDILHGDFIGARGLAAYAALAERLPDSTTWGLAGVFRTLLGYRCEAEKLLRIHDGVMLASPEYQHALRVVEHANDRFRADLAEVDELLRGILVPDGRTFPQVRMLYDHRWPDTDVKELESDEFGD